MNTKNKKSFKHNSFKKIIFFSISFSLFSVSFINYGYAQNENTSTKTEKQETKNDELSNLMQLNKNQYNENDTQKIDAESQNVYHKYIANPDNQDNRIISTYPKDYMLNENITITEDGSNLMVVRGSSRVNYNSSFNSSYTTNNTATINPSNSPCENENQYNSTNANSGLYMNMTNPDGSSMNFGAYFNTNTNSNQPRRKSSAQIFVDKKE